MALTAVMVLPIAHINNHQESLLSEMGQHTGGKWLAYFISIDAVLVLSGALLTSYVGVNGLIKRMTLDRILPQFLLKENKKGSSPRILLLFFVLCLSVLLLTKGALGPLAGVYTISFLLVMVYFAIGNVLLKVKRHRLPRPERASLIGVTVAIIAIGAALYGNVQMHPEYLFVFLQYFIPTMIVLFILLGRKEILKYLLIIVKRSFTTEKQVNLARKLRIKESLSSLIGQEFVYFTKGENVSVMNKVMAYVNENEITRKLRVVSVVSEHSKPINEKFFADLEVLDRAYPDISVDFIQISGIFGPELIRKLSEEWKIPVNFMFISTPGDRFTHHVSELGGVRVIV